MKKILLIIISFLFVITSACSSKPTKIQKVEKSQKIDFSTINGLFDKDCYSIVEDNNYVYYTTKQGIMSADKKTSNMRLIKPDNNPGCLALYSGRLYFADDSCEGKDTIKSVDLSGKDEKVIWRESDYINDKSLEIVGSGGFRIIDGLFYIGVSTRAVIKFDYNSNKAELFLDDAQSWDMHDGYAYYINAIGNTIYKKNLTTGKTQVVRNTGSVDSKDNLINFIFMKNDLYYATRSPSGLYKYNKGGKDTAITSLTDRYIEYLTEYDGDIYYVTSDENSEKFQLMKYDSASQKTSFVSEVDNFSQCGMEFVDGYAFYLVDGTETQIKWIPIKSAKK